MAARCDIAMKEIEPVQGESPSIAVENLQKVFGSHTVLNRVT